MYELPVCEHGWLDVVVGDETKRIGLTRIHMEEDAGKLVHDLPGGAAPPVATVARGPARRLARSPREPARGG